MAESTLQACSPLDAIEIRRGEQILRELDHFALVSLATGKADEAALTEAVDAHFQLTLPSIGHSALSGNEAIRVMGLQPGLWLMLFDHPGTDPLTVLNKPAFSSSTKDSALPVSTRLTNQSDAWVFLELQGPDSTTVLERLCPLDLDPDAFKVGDLARTVFELMGVILIRTEIDRWLMLSARSTASSFVHAIHTAVESVT